MLLFFKKNRHLLSLFLVSLIVITIYSVNFSKYGSDKIREIDEGAWIYSSYYYHLAFQKKDLSSPDWKNFDAIDHPPMAKFVYGFYFSLGSYLPKTIKLKEWWFQAQDIYKVERKSFVKHLRKRIPNEVLKTGRMVSSMFFVLTIIGTYLIMSKHLPFWINIFTITSLSLHHLFLGRSVQIISDSIYIFLMIIFFHLCMNWSQSLCELKSKKLKYYSGFLGVILGFMFMTKISGLLGFLLISFYSFCLLFFTKIYHHLKIKKILFQWGIISCFFILSSYLINPSLYDEPIQFMMKMFQHRLNRVNEQQNIFFTSSYPTLWLSISYFFKKIFMNYDWFFQKTYFPLFLFCFCFGVISLISKIKKNISYLAILIIGCGFISATAYTLKMNWERYLLPSLPWIFLYIGFGIKYIWDLKSKLPQKMYQIILVGILTSIIPTLTNYYDMNYFIKHNPQWKNERRVLKTLYYLKISPDNLELLQKLKKYYKRLNREDDFQEINKRIDLIKSRNQSMSDKI